MEELKQQYLNALGVIDSYDEDIRVLQNQKQEIHDLINSLKKKVKEKSNHLIGSKAIIKTEKNDEMICECTFIAINENFDVIPYFSHGNKRIKNVLSYEWEVKHG